MSLLLGQNLLAIPLKTEDLHFHSTYEQGPARAWGDPRVGGPVLPERLVKDFIYDVVFVENGLTLPSGHTWPVRQRGIWSALRSLATGQ